MKLITVDFETYYDKDFSLSEMSTWDYITDPRFEVIGVSVKLGGQPAQAFSGTHLEIHQFLSQFDWDESVVVGHHLAFDGAILRWRFGINPKALICTWSMCNALHGSEGSTSLARMGAKYDAGTKGTAREAALGKRRADFTPEQLNDYMSYCCDDSDITFNLFFKLMCNKFPEQELRVIDWTIRCYTDPQLCLDKNLLQEELQSVRKRHAEAWKAAGITDPGLLRQDDVLAAMLYRFGVDAPKKTTPKGNIKYAFAKGDLAFLELREHEDDRVVALVDARLEAKSSIELTRLESLYQISTQCRALPFPLSYFGASTGRWSAWDGINMQNLPKKGRIRECIMAPPGMVIIGADLSQIELRVLAWAAGQQDTLDTLEDGLDVYSLMAERIYRRPINKRDNPTERFVGKTAVLGCGYGAGWRKVGSMIMTDAKKYGITLEDTSDAFFQRVVESYRDANRQVVSMWYEAKAALPNMMSGGGGYIGKFEYSGNQVMMKRGLPLNFNNMRTQINPEDGRLEFVYSRFNQRTRKTSDIRLWQGLLVENIVQAAARDVLVNCLLTAQDMGYRCVGSVHDELLFVVEKECEPEAMKDIQRAMTTPPAWLVNCPLECEIQSGANYAEVH